MSESLFTGSPQTVAEVFPEERAQFIRRTYGHLAAAVAAFILLEICFLNSPVLVKAIFNVMQVSWLIILGGFVLLTWFARSLVNNTSVPVQYTGLALYVVAEGLIFVPLLFIAVYYSSPDVLPMAALLTTTLFIGLSVVAFTTRKDFSFLGSILTVGGLVAIGTIVAASIWGFHLGLVFSGAMVLLACGSILYDTSKIIHTHTPNQYVAASLELFASVMLLFWYILRIVMRLRR